MADRLADRFHVTGDSAQAIRTLFERPPGATGTFTVAPVPPARSPSPGCWSSRSPY